MLPPVPRIGQRKVKKKTTTSPQTSQVKIEITLPKEHLNAALSTLKGLQNLPRTALKAATYTLVDTLKHHFKTRQNQAQTTKAGFPNYGQTYPHRYFWYGVKGNSVAERIRQPTLDQTTLRATIPIDSPPLAHKLNINPPPIRPKGGRRYLAIPASAAAARHPGRAPEFPVPLHFGLATPPQKKHTFPALLDPENRPHYWLVRTVRTRHDPLSLPSSTTLQNALRDTLLRHLQKIS